MKNLKRLMAVVLTVVMLSTVSFATALSTSDAGKYAAYIDATTITQGTTTFTVDIGIKNTAGDTIEVPMNSNAGTFSTALSDEAVAAGIKATAITSDIVSITDAVFEDTLFYCNVVADKQALVLDANTPLLTVTFTIPADVAPGTYNLDCVDGDYDGLIVYGSTNEVSTSMLWWDDTPFVTVKAAQTEETKDFTATTVTSENFKGVTGDWYLGVWVGEYTVTSGSDTKAIKKISVTFTGDTDNHEFVVDKDREGNDLEIRGTGTTKFKVAIVGVPEALKEASKATATIEPIQ